MCFSVVLVFDNRAAEAAVRVCMCPDTTDLSVLQPRPVCASLQFFYSRCPCSSRGYSVADTTLQHTAEVRSEGIEI